MANKPPTADDGGPVGSAAALPGKKRQEHVPGGEGKKRRRFSDDQYKFIGEIRKACKRSDMAGGFASFREARRKGVQLPPDVLMSVMFLASGGEGWADMARQRCSNVGLADESAAGGEGQVEGLQGERYSEEILEYIKENKIETGEMGYVFQSRLAAVEGNPEKAFAFGQEVLQRGCVARLRMLHPALLGFASRGDTESALAVDSVIKGRGLDYTEYEFALLLEACSKSGSFEDFVGVAERVGKELNQLKESTLGHVEAFFRSERARSGLEARDSSGRGRWELRRVLVDGDGHCDFAGESLEGVDLDDAELEAFAEGVKTLVLQQEAGQSKFEAFVGWLGRREAANVLVDGANVAYYGQNREGGCFRFEQIEQMMQLLGTTWPEEKPLLVLHQNRTRGGRAEKAADFLGGLTKRKEVFSTPQGSNDDWYWLYAAVKAGRRGMLVSNDEMRDHIFNLLAPKYFLKWKERHLVRYTFVPDGGQWVPVLRFPNPYTACTQRLKNGVWMFPSAEAEEWLCAKPV